ncbi:MAG: hypothetical protein ACM336_07145 [Acidobacteriota bacterium]
MPERKPARLPLICRVLIGAAGWVVPRGHRSEWLRKWHDGAGHWWAFLHEREEFLIRDGYAQLVRHCATAFVDAFWLRVSRAELRRTVRGPAFVLGVAALFCCAAGFATGGFRSLRTAFQPLTYSDSERLVAIVHGGFGQYPNPPRQVARWKREATTLAGIAAWYCGRYPDGAYATPNLFSLLGVRPLLGRTFRESDRDGVLLSEDHWREFYHADPRVVGRDAIGVIPSDLPGLPGDVPFWRVLDLEARGSRRWLDTIARLKPGVSPARAQEELAGLAPDMSGVRVKRPGAPIRERTIFCMAAIAFGVLLGAVLVSMGRQSPVAARVSRAQAARAWGFLIVKLLLVLGGLPLLPPLLFLPACALAVLWCVSDQRRRCPVCLHRLAMPVTVGSWSSSFLDPAMTELLCENGHGALAMPETQSSATEPDRWTAMDESWRDLFSLK